MKRPARFGVAAIVLPVAALAACLVCAGTAAGQTETEAEYKAPRMASDHPDFQGRYTMETFTPLEMPEHLAGKELSPKKRPSCRSC